VLDVGTSVGLSSAPFRTETLEMPARDAGRFSGTGWDVTSPENVNPFEVTANKEVTAPYSVANPTGTPCNQFDNSTGKAVYEH